MLYLIYCVGRFASGFVHRSAYYISLRLTACPIYCVLVLHLLGSTRTSGTGANLILLSVFYIYGLRSIHSKGWMQRPRSTSVPLLCVPTDVSVLENHLRISRVTFESLNLTQQSRFSSFTGKKCLNSPLSSGARRDPAVPPPRPTGGHTGHLSQQPLRVHSRGFCLAQGAISNQEICSQVRLCCQESQRDCRVMAGREASLIMHRVSSRGSDVHFFDCHAALMVWRECLLMEGSR